MVERHACKTINQLRLIQNYPPRRPNADWTLASRIHQIAQKHPATDTTPDRFRRLVLGIFRHHHGLGSV